jgi:hypothetical protein
VRGFVRKGHDFVNLGVTTDPGKLPVADQGLAAFLLTTAFPETVCGCSPNSMREKLINIREGDRPWMAAVRNANAIVHGSLRHAAGLRAPSAQA